VVIVVASVLLGAVFVVAGVLKLSAPGQWRTQSADLGVPGAVAAALPIVELVVGALLIAQVARRAVAIVAALLLLAFTVVLVVRLVQGRRPPCACFGALSARPIGWGNVVRNGVLIVVAAVVAIGS
jgi:uncharacterized membrane protein YphA (DoxX/SURF4 family)